MLPSNTCEALACAPEASAANMDDDKMNFQTHAVHSAENTL